MWPSYYHTLKGNRHIWLWQCHQIYGSCPKRTRNLELLTNALPGSAVRYRPDGIAINSPTGYQAIYSPKANVTKAIFYRVWPRKAGEINTWTSIDNAKHAKLRRVLSHAFSEEATRSAEPFLIQHITRWCELLGENTEKEWSKPCDMAYWADCLVFDILGELCFGKSMEIKEPGQNEMKVMPSCLINYMRMFYPVSLASTLSMTVLSVIVHRSQMRRSQSSGCGSNPEVSMA